MAAAALPRRAPAVTRSTHRSGRAVAGWFEADADYAPPFHAVAARPVEAGRHALRVARGDGADLARVNFDVPAPAAKARRWAELSPPRQGALLEWLDGCGATVVVDRTCKVELPAPRAPPPSPPPARAAVEVPRGAVAVLPGFVDAEEAARIIELARPRLGAAAEANEGARGRSGSSDFLRRRRSSGPSGGGESLPRLASTTTFTLSQAGPKKRTNRSARLDTADVPFRGAGITFFGISTWHPAAGPRHVLGISTWHPAAGPRPVLGISTSALP